MSEAAATLLEQVLRLSEDERVFVARQVWDSLSEAKVLELEQEVEDPEFEAELERRLDEVQKHPESLLDGEEVLAELRERARRVGGQ